jgi:hypothetical protein
MKIQHRSELIKLVEHFGLKKVVAELGCAEGYFSRDLLDMGFEKLYMVDNWGTIEGITGDGNFPQEWHNKNFGDATRRVMDFGNEKVEILRGMTVEMAAHVQPKSLGLLYLDAGHSYQAVMADLVAWYDKVQDGGIIAGHDYVNPAYGVKQAVHDFVNGRFEVNVIPEDKDADAGFWFRKI